MLRNKNSSQTRSRCRCHQRPLPAASPPRAPAAPGTVSGLERTPPKSSGKLPPNLSPRPNKGARNPRKLYKRAKAGHGAGGCRQPLRNPNLRGFLGNILQLHPKPCLVLLSLTLQSGLGVFGRGAGFFPGRCGSDGRAGCRLSGTAAAASPRNCKTWGTLTDFSPPRRESHPPGPRSGGSRLS